MSETRASELILRSDLRGLLGMCRDWGAVFALTALGVWSDSWAVDLLCMLAIAPVQFAIGECLMHEASHYSLVRTRAWNDWAEALAALPFFTTRAAYRPEHLNHHRHFGGEEDHIVRDYAELGLLDEHPRLVWTLFVRPLLGLTGVAWLRWVIHQELGRGWLRVAGFWSAVLILAAATGTLGAIAQFWLAPLFFGYSVLIEWSEVEDHFRTASGTRSNVGWLDNLLYHDNGYHAAHHRYPAIPCHMLRRAHHTLGFASGVDIADGRLETWRQIFGHPERPGAPQPIAG